MYLTKAARKNITTLQIGEGRGSVIDARDSVREYLSPALFDYVERRGLRFLCCPSDHVPAWHNMYDYAIGVPRCFDPDTADLFLAHELGHLLPIPEVLYLNEIFYHRSLSGSRLFSILNLLTEIPACLFGYLLLRLYGRSTRGWRANFIGTISSYWYQKHYLLGKREYAKLPRKDWKWVDFMIQTGGLPAPADDFVFQEGN